MHGLDNVKTEYLITHLRTMRESVMRTVEAGDESFSAPKGRADNITFGIIRLGLIANFEEELESRGITPQGREFGPDVRKILILTQNPEI
jgi:hypothetical protein